MALSESLLIETSKKNGPRCGVCALLPTLDKDDRVALDGALANIGVTGTAIARALAREGIDVKADSIRRHRKRECAGL